MPLLPPLPDLSLVPRWLWVTLLVLACFAPIPFAMVARMRSVPAEQPRIHIVPNMDNQGRYKAQQANPEFLDGRAMREAPEHTVAREASRTVGAIDTGFTESGYVTEIPFPVTEEFVRRGQDRFDIYCAPCHGYAGYGDGMIAQRADFLAQGTWVQPASLHEDPATTREIGFFFNTITNGVRNMPAYGSQISVDDRWAIVSYVKALQLSQGGGLQAGQEAAQ
ncbi:MAG: cytochrome c [Acidobacteriota bacterium]|nr:cytochrome c [Acidobacteriota bacterium]